MSFGTSWVSLGTSWVSNLPFGTKTLIRATEDELELIYGFEWKIFKDKFNSKPPGGEGVLHILM